MFQIQWSVSSSDCLKENFVRLLKRDDYQTLWKFF